MLHLILMERNGNTSVESSDTGLAERARSGDTAAFTVLYERYKQALFGYCVRLLGNRDAAEDVLQNAFLRAFEGLPALRATAVFRTWLFTIARNEAYMHLRRPRAEPAGEEIVWEEDSPADAAGRADEAELVRSLLARLKPEYREVLVLLTYDGMSYADIARITGASISAVEARIFRARRALAAALRPYVSERRAS